MARRITIIEDSRDTQIKFLQTLSLQESVEIQAITTEPFFDEKIEEAIREFNPALIILDLRLTRNNDSGFRVLRKLKESVWLSDIPVVVCSKFITKDSADRNRKMAMAYGADAALPKVPFPKAESFLSHARSIEAKSQQSSR